ncbi:peptidase M28-like protein [Neolewinella xylanilytica]|uniref:Peptidase M28-like protein n=1 Tax=Neolewinella xylanilytica TaxID=1514080 RepID=A0A2S6I0N1_9BACT|nr:M28 family peptidase [Neolewinella xylanilytica]PPK84389.1 peptidase M28-like protein [Neolewinella xylanilytica]
MIRTTLPTLLFALLASIPLRSQQLVDRSLPEFSFDSLQLAGEMHFLASDFLAGRRTGSPGNEIAAEYIAAQLRGFGYEPINSADSSYFQEVPLRRVQAPTTGLVTIGDNVYSMDDDLLVVRGPEASAETEVVFANFGWVDPETGENDYADLDVEGKIVITRAGLPGDQSQQAVFRGIQEKAEMAAAAGAVALFEIYSLPFPWNGFRNYLGGERLTISAGESADIPYGFIRFGDDVIQRLQQAGTTMEGAVTSSGMRVDRLDSRNVGGILRGSDPEVSDEYLLMTAHFDHVGVGRQGGGAYTEADSIFNGARDNAIGTISLLAAARAFAERPPRRSVIVLAVTGEEMGLLGSKYYADHPLVPLEQTVFNFNTDGGGYNDTSAISLIGANRTGIDEQVNVAAKAFGKRVISDPAPEQGLFDRSDNVSFAAMGVPALTFAPGFGGFDDTIMRYYHQVTDNPETINMRYLTEYCQIFTLAARLIANRDVVPFWTEGDKYEAAGKSLYGTGK